MNDFPYKWQYGDTYVPGQITYVPINTYNPVTYYPYGAGPITQYQYCSYCFSSYYPDEYHSCKPQEVTYYKTPADPFNELALEVLKLKNTEKSMLDLDDLDYDTLNKLFLLATKENKNSRELLIQLLKEKLNESVTKPVTEKPLPDPGIAPAKPAWGYSTKSYINWYYTSS